MEKKLWCLGLLPQEILAEVGHVASQTCLSIQKDHWSFDLSLNTLLPITLFSAYSGFEGHETEDITGEMSHYRMAKGGSRLSM